MEESHKMMSLTVTVTEGATFYMPLYSRDLQPHTSAVLISLRAAEMTANIRRDSSLYAKFNHLKTTFIENFDERLGCMVGSINNTITSVEEHALDVWDRERMMLSGISKERDDEIDPDNVLSTIVHPGAKLNWLEQKMYDQTRKIDELTKMGTRGGCLEKEKKRLKKYALVRAQHFKHSMLDRLKRRKIKRTGAAELLPYQNESVSKGIAEVFMGLNGMQNVTAEVTNQVEESSTASMTGESSEDTNSTQPSTTPTGSESSISKPSSEVLSFDEISLPITPSAEDERFIATSKSDNVDVQVSGCAFINT
ncbi:unnamed protein product [Toxocara canis]|uniref:IMD domain-containing protein n=1 Tax=Toxocara canis TaxID=6265 RepID=A0A183UPP1_TOXCA|nr:unnamed protein product [Toxocara canis]